MSKDVKKALEHCIDYDCVDCPNNEELGSGENEYGIRSVQE